MHERELMTRVTDLAGRTQSVKQLLESIAALLTTEVGSAILFLRPLAHGHPLFPEAGLGDFNVTQFLDSRDFPFRGVYTARIVSQGRHRATLVACFGTWGAPGEILRQVTLHVAEQIGGIIARAGCRPFEAEPESASRVTEEVARS